MRKAASDGGWAKAGEVEGVAVRNGSYPRLAPAGVTLWGGWRGAGTCDVPPVWELRARICDARVLLPVSTVELVC